MRVLLAMGLLISGVALAEPTLRLPPTETWKEVDGEAGSRVFLWKGKESVRLTVALNPGLHGTYTGASMLELSRKVAKEGRAEGREVRITEASAFTVRGMSAGRMRIAGTMAELRFWLPGDEGDLEISLLQSGDWSHDAENEVTNVVALASGLRGKAGMTDDAKMALFAGVTVGVLALAIVVMLVRRALSKKR